VTERLKAPARRLLRRRGFTVFRDRPPRDLANPLPVELAAHRLLLRAVLERREVNCVIDVGAHTGGFASELREAGYGGEIVSVEPIAESFEALSARTREDPRWRAHRLALGRAEGRARMHVARQSNFTSFLRPTPFSVEWLAEARSSARRRSRSSGSTRCSRRSSRMSRGRRACCSRPTPRAGTSR
jgi:FkbM family methyltransferase